jgi:hypothetical protein
MVWMKAKEQLIGKWRIFHMDDFDKEDINMEVPAYIKIENGSSGDFQFILVCGNMCGDFKMVEKGAIFDFTWDGTDENDEASGDGWLKSEDGKTGTGQIRFHNGDTHNFLATKVRK